MLVEFSMATLPEALGQYTFESMNSLKEFLAKLVFSTIPKNVFLICTSAPGVPRGVRTGCHLDPLKVFSSLDTNT